MSDMSETYESKLQLQERELLSLSNEYVLNLELQKKEIEQRDSRLHEIFEEVSLKQVHLYLVSGP